MPRFVLKLFVTGRTPKSERAIQNLQRICAEELAAEYRIEVIDVLEHPDLAEQEKVLATPTLIKELPPPLRRIIGDLTDRDKVITGLDLLHIVTPGDDVATRPVAPAVRPGADSPRDSE